MIQIFILFCTLILSACGSTPHKKPLGTGPIQTNSDPSDRVLFTKIDTYLQHQNGPQNSRYDYARLDMNGDGLRDALVLFRLPHSYWCGWGGCTMAVFEARGSDFILRSEITNVRGPITVSDTTTQRWRDIILRVTGVNMPDRNVILRFEHGAYPSNPVAAQTYPYDSRNTGGERFFP